MERIHSINAERIAWCCADQGIALDDLAREIGVSPGTLDAVMRGEGGLSFRQLSTMAEYFGRGVLFFLEQGAVNDAQVHSLQFRSLANRQPDLSPRLRRLIERVERQRDIYLALREDVDADELPRFSPPRLEGLGSAEAAGVVRSWLGLGPRNDFGSYRRAIEARGVLVFRSNGYAGKWQIEKDSPVSGFALYDPHAPVIVVKKQDSEARQSFTLMHELGHLLLHRASWIDDEEDMQSYEGHEAEANAFAGHLLVPDELLAGVSDAARPDDAWDYRDWLQEHCRAWGVSAEVILRRLLDARRLSREQYAAYRAWSQQQGLPAASPGGTRIYRHREPTHIFGEAYVRTVLDALSARRISLAKASSYLDNLTISDLHKLEAQHAGV